MKKSILVLALSALILPGAVSATVFKTSRAPQASQMRAPMMAEENAGVITDVIYEAPEGTHLKMDRSGVTFPLYGAPFWYDNNPQNLVVCDNGDVYLPGTFFSYAEGTYLVGHKDGDQVVFDLPQTLINYDYGGGYSFVLNATLGQFSESNEKFFPVNSPAAAQYGFPEVENKIVFTVDENGVYTYDSGMKIVDGELTINEGDMILCMCDPNDDSWFGPAEVNMTLRPFTGKLVTPPADLETETMGFTYNGVGRMMEVGYDGDDVYFKGIVEDFPDSWIKGTLIHHTTNGDILNVPSGQYLGENFRHAVFAFYASALYDKETGLMQYLDSIDFFYEPETKTFKAPGGEVGLYNGATDYVHYIEMYEDMMIRPQVEDPEITLNAPSDIVVNETGWYPSVEFNYSSLNQEGYILDASKLYYVMYVDGEEFTFTEYDYWTPADWVYVPVEYSDDWTIISSGGHVLIYLDFEGFDNLGFKLVYAEADEDGEVTEVLAESKTAWLNETGVSMTGTDASAPVYYDMTGRRVLHPAKGDILIERRGNGARKVVM